MEQPPRATQPDAAGPATGPEHGPPNVTVTCTRDGATARIEVVGELTDTARRPLVRELTDLMLSRTPLTRVELDLCEVSFLNSAGIAALVQLQKLAQPRGIELALAVESIAVIKPLQLSGLWHRFTVLDRREGHDQF
ncbi:STAS domain-containing protein [Modestobacter lapidis]|nr:STAS domain-containing protein [Modestobacter lapidis]